MVNAPGDVGPAHEGPAPSGYCLLFTDGNDNDGSPRIGGLLKHQKGSRWVEMPGGTFSAPAYGESIDDWEFQALIAGLKLAQELGVRHVAAYMDRRSVVEQVNKRSTTVARLKPYLEEVALLSKEISFELSWIPREMNRAADQLARSFGEAAPSGEFRRSNGGVAARFDTLEHPETLMQVLDRNVRDAASWRLASEVARRYPEDVFLLDAFPITGVDYDCLRIARLDRPGTIDINRNAAGSARRLVEGLDTDVWPAFLMEWLSVADRRRFLRRVSAWFGLPPIKKVPPTTKRTLAYRAIAGFLEAHALDRPRTAALGAAFVDDLDQPRLRDHLIQQFPKLELPHLVPQGPSVTVKEPAFCVWFIVREVKPTIYVTADARASDGSTDVDLFQTYAATKRIDDVIAQMASLSPS